MKDAANNVGLGEKFIALNSNIRKEESLMNY